LELAVQHGADLNAYDGSGIPPAILAAASFAQYDLALQILKLGADPKRTRRDTLFTLAHALAISSERLELMLPSERAAYNKLVQFLQGQGIDTELAKEDSKRWSTWGRTLSIPESKRRMDAEMAKVKRENAAALPQRMTE
jgi:biotin operon repressor